MGKTSFPSVVCFQIIFMSPQNKSVFIFISQLSYKHWKITVLNQEQVPKEAKHGTEVIKRTECLVVQIHVYYVSTLASKRPPHSL